eukprot:14607175-Heterocapsa_arctica.AAC.1
MSAMRLDKHERLDQYETPLRVEVSHSAYFQQPLLCSVPGHGPKKVVRLPASLHGALGMSKPCGDQLTLSASGVAFKGWSAWKCCSNRLPSSVQLAMQGQGAFGWYMLHRDVYHLGFPIPEQTQKFHQCFLAQHGSSSGESDSETEEEKEETERPF